MPLTSESPLSSASTRKRDLRPSIRNASPSGPGDQAAVVEGEREHRLHGDQSTEAATGASTDATPPRW